MITDNTSKLIFCLKCGKKQIATDQKYCANCGKEFFKTKSEVYKKNNILSTKNYNPGKIGGWLILPYVGLYFSTLVGLIGILNIVNSSTNTPSDKAVILGTATVIIFSAISCIIYIHKRNKDLIIGIITLYMYTFIYTLINSHNPSIIIGSLLGSIIWISYFLNSKRVKTLLKIN